MFGRVPTMCSMAECMALVTTQWCHKECHLSPFFWISEPHGCWSFFGRSWPDWGKKSDISLLCKGKNLNTTHLTVILCPIRNYSSIQWYGMKRSKLLLCKGCQSLKTRVKGWSKKLTIYNMEMICQRMNLGGKIWYDVKY